MSVPPTSNVMYLQDSDASSVGRPDDMLPLRSHVEGDGQEEEESSDTLGEDEEVGIAPVSCFHSMAQDDEEVVEGLAGAPYRGFGRCFKCSESFSYCSVYTISFLSDDPLLFR